MEWMLPLAVTCVLLLVASLAVAAYGAAKAHEALIEVKAIQRSTHQVQFVPAESLMAGGPSDDELGNAAGKIERDHYERIDDIIRDTDSMI